MDLSDADLQQHAEADGGKSIRRSGWRRPRGRQEASSIGGSKSVSNGSAGYAVQTAVKGGSELLIFVPRAAHSYDWSSSFVAGAGRPIPLGVCIETWLGKITRYRAASLY